MKPESKSNRLLGVTRSKAKMIEYHVPAQYQEIDLSIHPNKLFSLSIGLLGDLAEGINSDRLSQDAVVDTRKNMLFAAHFFDAYLSSKLNETLTPYLILLGSATYYLCDLPGSSAVLAKRIEGDCPDLNADGLEDLLLWLLQGNYSTIFDGSTGYYGAHIDSISRQFAQFYNDGTIADAIIVASKKMRTAAYSHGTPRQLLVADIISAVLTKKINNSSWNALPLYSGLTIDIWREAIEKDSFIKELWPAQHLIGKEGILKGASAVIQMPTSAGKTKATEIVIRSAFLAERATLVVIIAPFRALCHEIKNSFISAFSGETTAIDELSDAMQTDFEIDKFIGHRQIIIVTPEKLLYVLRHSPELATNIGLVIFDEGHQFDSGSRGITYELLLTSLRSMLPVAAQKILISAVISNAAAIGEWLNGDPMVVEGTNLNPTYRSVGFASWLDTRGKIEYTASIDAEKNDFFVPRVIESLLLKKLSSERKQRIFPDKKDGQTVALFLGFKLTRNGSVAIYCGRKTTVTSVCEKAITAIEHGLALPLPKDFSDLDEIKRLHYLIMRNLGKEATSTKSALHGIFSHHGNTPQGIRLAVEHAMREGTIHFVVCTSTLAQGVNLPIRYLIVTSIYQGVERIKVRDFHNLIGRAGRAGMHTEGSILFADPVVFDNRNAIDGKWRWKQVEELLEPKNSEPCVSNLLSIFDHIKSDDDRFTLKLEGIDFVKAYLADPKQIDGLAESIANRHSSKGFSRDGVERQIKWKITLISAIESFILSHWDELGTTISEEDIVRLSTETLAYFLADEEKRLLISELFKLIAANITTNVNEPARRNIYGKTLFGLRDALAIEAWAQSNTVLLYSTKNEFDILKLIWPLILEYNKNNVFKKIDPPVVLQELAAAWIAGSSFSDILKISHKRDAKLRWGTRKRDISIDNIIDICEGALSYDGALSVSAVCEFISLPDKEETKVLQNRLALFQKQLKYGLLNAEAIVIYEMGFTDRVIAQELARFFEGCQRKKEFIKTIETNADEIAKALMKYPSYFQKVLNRIIGQ